MVVYGIGSCNGGPSCKCLEVQSLQYLDVVFDIGVGSPKIFKSPGAFFEDPDFSRARGDQDSH